MLALPHKMPQKTGPTTAAAEGSPRSPISLQGPEQLQSRWSDKQVETKDNSEPPGASGKVFFYQKKSNCRMKVQPSHHMDMHRNIIGALPLQTSTSVFTRMTQ